MAGDVGGGRQLGRSHDGVAAVDGDEALVEGPVAEMAEGDAVAGVVIEADAPGDDVGGGDGGVAAGRQHANTAEGAAVVAGGGTVLFCLGGDDQHSLAGINETAIIAERVFELLRMVQGD